MRGEGKVGAHAVAACSCRRSSSVTLAFGVVELIHYPGTQGSCGIRVSTVYLPQVFLGTHLSTNPFGRMNSWVSCVLTARVWDRTRASGFIMRRANHCTTEAQCEVTRKIYKGGLDAVGMRGRWLWIEGQCLNMWERGGMECGRAECMAILLRVI